MRPVAVTFAAAVLLVSGCGSQNRTGTRAAAAPKLPRSVAVSLAARSDILAAALRRGDACAARIQMHGLERETRLAIARGRVPVVLRPRLLAAEQSLASRVPGCVPPAPPPPPPPPPAPPEQDHGKEHGKGHGHGPPKKHGHGEGD